VSPGDNREITIKKNKNGGGRGEKGKPVILFPEKETSLKGNPLPRVIKGEGRSTRTLGKSRTGKQLRRGGRGLFLLM